MVAAIPIGIVSRHRVLPFVLASLEHYIQLMNVWPFIIRTIDFEVRHDAPRMDWLTR